MCRVPARTVYYIVAFEGDTRPHLMRERDLMATDDPPAEIQFATNKTTRTLAKEKETAP